MEGEKVVVIGSEAALATMKAGRVRQPARQASA